VAAAGVAAGGLLAIAAARGVAGALYGISAADPIAWLGAAGTIALVALMANAIPARRAAIVDPSVALRNP
jgi:putative ABC transport system permease protein